MRLRSSVCRIALRAALPLFLTCLAGAAPHYDAIYVFGDSYCDVGNIYIATAHAIPLSPPYYQGRFSNGPIWVEHVAGAMGLPLGEFMRQTGVGLSRRGFRKVPLPPDE
jgi:phospholipase/lecithinase/hemolysin